MVRRILYPDRNKLRTSHQNEMSQADFAAEKNQCDVVLLDPRSNASRQDLNLNGFCLSVRTMLTRLRQADLVTMPGSPE